MKWISVLAAALLSLQAAWAQTGRDLGPQPPGHFDFYVLSLTWVPGFCATHRDPAECRQDLGFRLHGLWPESMNGWPANCSSDALPESVRAAFVHLFPSPGMIGHEWSAHGSCTALGPSGFYAATQAALASVAIPPEYQHRGTIGAANAPAVKAAFLAANPNLRPGSLALVCAGRRISEIHVCLTRQGSARVCEPWELAEDNCR